MRRLIPILACLLVAVTGCKSTEPPAPVIRYRTVMVPVVQPDTSLGALRDWRDAVVAHGRVVRVVEDDSGRVLVQFADTPRNGNPIAFAMGQLLWVQQMLDAMVEIINERTTEQ